MTSTELALFKDMIKECVREVIKEELGSTLIKENKEVKKDLLLIKKLIAKSIQESRRSVSTVKSNKHIIAEQARKTVKEEREIFEDETETRPFEDTLDGLYRIWGGKEAFDRSTMGSKPLTAGASASPTSTPQVNLDPLKDVLADTKRSMTDEDIAYVSDGIREAKKSVPPEPTPQRIAVDEQYSTDRMPDFDPIEMAKRKRR